jgi:hypothetical protein
MSVSAEVSLATDDALEVVFDNEAYDEVVVGEIEGDDADFVNRS